MATLTAYIEFDQQTGLYVGVVPGVPGAHTQAASLDELHANLREILELCFEEDAGLGGRLTSEHARMVWRRGMTLQSGCMKRSKKMGVKRQFLRLQEPFGKNTNRNSEHQGIYSLHGSTICVGPLKSSETLESFGQQIRPLDAPGNWPHGPKMNRKVRLDEVAGPPARWLPRGTGTERSELFCRRSMLRGRLVGMKNP